VGTSLQRLGRRSEAIAHHRIAARQRPQEIEFYLQLAEALEEDGQRAEAIAQLERALNVAPAEDGRPRQRLAQLRAAGKP
jgi:Flp pilus assembly protein TadD